ncbi:MAG TPA: DNA repair protein RadC [Bacteroidales bacterium]|jgi:DNA repair protein RadC|nr:DNA repair protein RadC [Bacteroidales bacterium]HOF45424.1 DNA repair protein RadC [Bacteroidales bacterium]HOS57800.1 DNA repair protein RadC [Bacteroidales bacterium]HPY80815.1 DNA repair protein RadC [Bacteroidales bacterium]HQA86821.1 DNA repair protein RadC [Bacteroidales bacterium]
MVKTNKLTIREWDASDRPREKYLSKGKNALSNAELLAILFRNGTAQESALDLSKRLLTSANNSLNQLANFTVEELLKIKGIGNAKAITVLAAFELGRRRRSEKIEEQKKIKYTEDVIELMQHQLADLKYEEFWVIFVNQSSTIIKMEKIGKGGITSTTVDIRLIMKSALECFATGIILCHNHPSGAVKPSQADIQLTNTIKQASTILNISLIDHVIMSNEKYYSFFSEGLI